MQTTTRTQLPQAKRMLQIRKHFKISQVKLAKIIGEEENVIKMIEQSRTKKIREKHLTNLKNKLGISPIWLTEGKGNMLLEGINEDEILSTIDTLVNSLNPNLIEIPFYTDIYMQDKTKIQITKNFLPHLVAKTHIKAVQIQDDTMTPTINPNDIILINTQDTTIEEGKIYLITINDKPYIKRIFTNPTTNETILRADNQLYPQLNTKSKFAIIGKIFGNISINKL